MEGDFKKETPTQVFSCEFSEFLRMAFYRTPPVAASVRITFISMKL